jgi:putative membrane protein
MAQFVIQVLINGAVIFAIAYFIPALIRVTDVQTALIAALVLGVVNAVIRPIALLLTIPFNLITLGLFTLVVNAFMLYIAAAIVGGFDILGFWQAIVAALLISVVSSWLTSALGR